MLWFLGEITFVQVLHHVYDITATTQSGHSKTVDRYNSATVIGIDAIPKSMMTQFSGKNETSSYGNVE
jgi:hypothetical protein